MPISNSKLSCMTCPNRKKSAWGVLAKTEINKLDNNRLARKFQSGSSLYYQGDECGGIFCIAAGLIGVCKSDAMGNSVILSLNHPGEILGSQGIHQNENYTTGATVLKPSEVCFISRPTVQSLMEKNNALRLQFLKLMSKNLGSVEDNYFNNSTRRARARLAHLLSDWRSKYGRQMTGAPIQIQLPTNRKNLAALIGISPESLSRITGAMEQEGIVKFSKDIVTILNQTNLNREFNSEQYL